MWTLNPSNHSFNSRFRSIPLLYLSILSILLFLLLDIIWAKFNFSFGYWSMADHNFKSVIDLFIKFKKGDFLSQLRKIIWNSYGHGSYPSLYFIIQALFASIVNRLSYPTMVLSNFFLFLISFFLIYKMGLYLKDKKAGYMAGIFLSLYPGIYGISRHCMLENGIIPITILVILSLIRTQNFTSTRYSILLGISLGIGFLTKYHFAIFVAGGICYEIFLLVKNWSKLSIRTNLKKCFNLILITGAVLAISLPYYLKNYHLIIRFFSMSFHTNLPPGPEIVKSGSLASWLFYLFTLINFQLSLPLFTIFAGALFYLLSNKTRILKNLHLLLWILIPYLFLQSGDTKWARYSIGYLPACALISGVAISNLKDKWTYLLIVPVLLFGHIQNVYFSFLSPEARPLIQTALFKDRSYFDVNGNIYLLVHSHEIHKPDYINKIQLQLLEKMIEEHLSTPEDNKIAFFLREEHGNAIDYSLVNHLRVYSIENDLEFNLSYIKEEESLGKRVSEKITQLNPNVIVLKLIPSESEKTPLTLAEELLSPSPAQKVDNIFIWTLKEFHSGNAEYSISVSYLVIFLSYTFN